MGDDEQRNDDCELLVAGFVPKCFHCCVCADASAYCGEHQQHVFRDAPLIASGFVLVDCKCRKRDDVDYNDVNDHYVLMILKSDTCPIGFGRVSLVSNVAY